MNREFMKLYDQELTLFYEHAAEFGEEYPGVGERLGEIARAGADTFVAGSAIFGTDDYAATIASMPPSDERYMAVLSPAPDDDAASREAYVRRVWRAMAGRSARRSRRSAGWAGERSRRWPARSPGRGPRGYR